ncbi:MAG: hypothetical protein Q8922_11720 [Bacteroidota bacterium]|nr:hypothetical protein [Bacteroidota bacterium]MDP4234650.1 hypothetical protein [Bacteroidota bacterium]MDP4243815.1 hypothetical protein [Bacteroidota bacterium]MDP4288594.1 hypothetical protein [Bacteroidota bacterium]
MISISIAHVLLATTILAQVHIHTKITRYVPPRPAFAGLHVGLSKDSAFMLMSRISTRRDTLHVDSIILLESDSVQILGLPAYVELQLLHGSVRTVVINWHPLAGERYTNLRDNLSATLERAFGRGVVLTNGSLTYHRWETEDGTSEVSHSDKYMRIFLRLGKPRE